jgi:hypothetical protein
VGDVAPALPANMNNRQKAITVTGFQDFRHIGVPSRAFTFRSSKLQQPKG